MKYSLAKIITIVLALVLFSGANAGDNSIYINQSGSSSTVSVTQDGAGNTVEGIQGTGTDKTTPATITGNNNTVTVTQIGTGDTLQLGIRTSIANGYTGNNYIYNVTGNNATAVINSNADGSGTSASNNVTVNQTGNTANLNLTLLGTNNNFTATTAGGASNSVVAAINGTNGTDTITT